tara:strand:- start:156 stop:1019 length:864 start_codon:yes stop_codon:yes gene_type:complete
MKIFKYLIESIFIYTFFLIIKLLGLNNGRKLFSFIFNKIGPLIKSKKITNENLERALGKDKSQNKKIISKMWSNYGMTFVEYLYLKSFKNTDSHISIKGTNILEKIIQEDKPVIFVSGHFANFELMSMELCKKGINLATIYRPLNNFFLNPFMEFVRRKYVCKNQIKKGRFGTREAIEYIKKNYSVALMIDQRVSEGKLIPFFKKDSLTTTLPAQLAIRYKCNIVPVHIIRKSNELFEMEVYEPIDILKFEDSEKSKIEISLKLNKIIENMIIKEPSQWIWTHNRWK